MPAVIALLLCLLLPVRAAAGATTAESKARDHLYEAADLIDEGRAELNAGRQAEGERLLSEAEDHLRAAEKLAPDMPRLAYERARLLRIDGDPRRAEQLLVASLRGPVVLGEHLKAVELMDALRKDQGKVTLGAEWRANQVVRNAGIGVIAGGVGVALAGFGAAFGTFANGVYQGIDDTRIGANRGAWAAAAVGGGIAVAGAGVTVAGQVGIDKLRIVLPGPWRWTFFESPALRKARRFAARDP
jgi:hypothetical protein